MFVLLICLLVSEATLDQLPGEMAVTQAQGDTASQVLASEPVAAHSVSILHTRRTTTFLHDVPDVVKQTVLL